MNDKNKVREAACQPGLTPEEVEDLANQSPLTMEDWERICGDGEVVCETCGSKDCHT